MSNLQRTLAVAILAVITFTVISCAPYQSRIDIGAYKFSFPKDASFSWLHAEIPTTNGAASVTISNGVFKMNPAVIDAKTAHDTAIINATAQAVGAIAGSVGGGLAK